MAVWAMDEVAEEVWVRGEEQRVGGLQDPRRVRNYDTRHSRRSRSAPSSCRAFFMSWPLVLLDLEYADLDGLISITISSVWFVY